MDWIFISICILTSIILISLVLSIKHTNNIALHMKNNLNMKNTGSKYIPKQIYQTVKDKKNISPLFRKNINSIKKLNKGWVYYLFDDNDIVEYIQSNYPPEIMDIYNSINPKYGASRADFFRYLLVYKEGGVYLDVKSGMKVPLDQILHEDDHYLLSHWDCPCQKGYVQIMEGEYQQWHVIASPEHRIPYSKPLVSPDPAVPSANTAAVASTT